MPPIPPARCAWVVTAGLAPGEIDPAYTRRWELNAADWNSPQGAAIYHASLAAAQEYARQLMDPRALNWVRVEWIWY